MESCFSCQLFFANLRTIFVHNVLYFLKNILKTEIMKTFNIYRPDFEPYGLTCEQWQTNIMPRFDRHNEIELNYSPDNSITYFFRNQKITIPPRQLAIFWGLVPHRVIEFDKVSSYYVCTIPLSLFLNWGLPNTFVSQVLGGDVLIDENASICSEYDLQLMNNWLRDLSAPLSSYKYIVETEMQCRLLRMSTNFTNPSDIKSDMYCNDATKIEKIALFIASNYQNPILLSDIARAVGLHPDYANTIFKKAFGHTINQHLCIERISNAQRLLLTTAQPIAQVASDCGFNSMSCFNSSFLKYNNCTPSIYRKMYMHRDTHKTQLK